MCMLGTDHGPPRDPAADRPTPLPPPPLQTPKIFRTWLGDKIQRGCPSQTLVWAVFVSLKLVLAAMVTHCL